MTIRIPVDKIRDVIGPGGKMIRSIIERTGVKIDVEDDGRVNVASADGASAQKAISIIQELTATPELNKTYLGKVQRITDFGAFVEIMPGTDGLLHVSEIANHRVKDVRDELKEGEQLLVKVINIDPTGKIRLSRKALLQEEAAATLKKSRGSGLGASCHGSQGLGLMGASCNGSWKLSRTCPPAATKCGTSSPDPPRTRRRSFHPPASQSYKRSPGPDRFLFPDPSS